MEQGGSDESGEVESWERSVPRIFISLSSLVNSFPQFPWKRAWVMLYQGSQLVLVTVSAENIWFYAQKIQVHVPLLKEYIVMHVSRRLELPACVCSLSLSNREAFY